jgi:hypothetical protein
MASLGDWGPDTNGSEHNDPNLNHDQFHPLDVKNVSPEEHERHVSNIVDSVRAASPSERRAGARFYPRAHRDATRVGLGLNPGKQPYGGTGAERPGRDRMPKDVAARHVADPKSFDTSTRRGAGAIAALSPSSPAGMDWEHNPTAAHEVWGLTTEHVAKFRAADEASGVASKATGALGKAKRQKSGVREAQAASDTAKSGYAAASAEARPALDSSVGLRHAGNKAILRAHSILSGEQTPEEALPMKAKTGHFYENIAGADDKATVDGRSHDIALGEHHPWDTSRGLGAAGRYKYFNDAHVEARDQLGMRSTSAVQATSWIQDKNAMLAKSTPALRNLGRANLDSRPGR